MKIKLKKIASIQMGYSFRSRLVSINLGNVGVIQMKDLTAENRVDCGQLARIDMDNLKKHHLVKSGDLVFRSRGQISTSAIIGDIPGKAVVAAPLLKIRVTDSRIIPEYLNWYISQKPAQSFLTSRADGTVQKMISKETLESLVVQIPPIEKQQAIVELTNLSYKEQSIMEKLALKRKQLISATLLNMTKEET